MQTEPPYSLSVYLFFLVPTALGLGQDLVMSSQFYSWIVARNTLNTIGKAFSLGPDTYTLAIMASELDRVQVR